MSDPLRWNRTDILTRDGARLATFTIDPASATPASPTVIMAHGWTLDHRSWDPVARALLADDDVRLVAWDQRGHGDSTFANGGRRPGSETVRALGEDLLAVLETVPQESPVVLAGHSMGGMTIMAFAGLHPDVLRARVRGVVLVGTAASDLRGPKLPGQALAIKALSRVPLRLGLLVNARAQRRVGFGRGAKPEDVQAGLEQIRNTRWSTASAYYPALMTHNETAALVALGELPVRVVAGSRDHLTPVRHARALAEAMPGALLEVVQDAGHMLTYEATDVVHAAIRDVLA